MHFISIKRIGLLFCFCLPFQVFSQQQPIQPTYDQIETILRYLDISQPGKLGSSIIYYLSAIQNAVAPYGNSSGYPNVMSVLSDIKNSISNSSTNNLTFDDTQLIEGLSSIVDSVSLASSDIQAQVALLVSDLASLVVAVDNLDGSVESILTNIPDYSIQLSSIISLIQSISTATDTMNGSMSSAIGNISDLQDALGAIHQYLSRTLNSYILDIQRYLRDIVNGVHAGNGPFPETIKTNLTNILYFLSQLSELDQPSLNGYWDLVELEKWINGQYPWNDMDGTLIYSLQNLLLQNTMNTFSGLFKPYYFTGSQRTALQALLSGNTQNIIQGTQLALQTDRIIPNSAIEQWQWIYTVSNTAPYVSLLPRWTPQSRGVNPNTDTQSPWRLFNTFGNVQFNGFSFDSTGNWKPSYSSMSSLSAAYAGRPSEGNFRQYYFTDWLADFLKFSWYTNRVDDTLREMRLRDLLSNYFTNSVPTDVFDPNDGTWQEPTMPLPSLPSDEFTFEVPDYSDNDTLDLLQMYGSQISDGMSLGHGSDGFGFVLFPSIEQFGITETTINLQNLLPRDFIQSFQAVMRVVWNFVGFIGSFMLIRRNITESLVIA